MTLTHFSLFTGIGGIDIAASWAGFTTVGMCEIDDYCRKVLNKHWPDVPKWGDIFELKGEEILDKCGRISLLSGGFPCQPFSAAGKRKGQADERYLWPEMLRIIREVKPRWVLGENVRGILSIDAGRTFGRILKDLAESGYRVGWLCYGAGDVGAPHKRERVFIVAYAMHLRHGGEDTERRSPAAPEGIPGINRQENRASGDFIGADIDRWAGIGNKYVADTDSKQTNKQLCPSYRSCRQQGQAVEAGEKAARPQDGKAGNNDTSRFCEALADTPQHLLNRPRQARPAGRGEFTDGGAGSTQSRLGSMVNEFSTRMDGGINNADAREKGTREVLPALREKDEAKTLQRQTGGHGSIPSPEILQPSMCRSSKTEGYTTWNPQTLCLFTGQQVPRMWCNREFGSAPSRRQPCQQRHLKFNDFMRFMSYEMALEEREEAIQEAVCLHRLWQSCKEVGYVPKTLSEVQEIWKSLSDQEKAWIAFRVSGRTGWPAGPGEQYPWEPPRIATGVKDRVARLKALGNAVVPAQVYPILKAISEIERGMSE